MDFRDVNHSLQTQSGNVVLAVAEFSRDCYVVTNSKTGRVRGTTMAVTGAKSPERRMQP
jgi:hypothetical protein